MEILLLGAGAMGTLLGSYLSKNHDLIIYDVDRSKSERLAREIGATFLTDLKARSYDMALICAPISETSRIVDSLSEEMSSGSIIMEISSLKSPVMNSLRRASSRGMRVVSLHPLFGPGLRDLTKGEAALVRISDPREEFSIASTMFPFHLIPIEAEEHDRAMAWLALVHLLLRTFLKSSDAYAELISKLLTTTLNRFLELAVSSLTQSDELTEELISLNPYFPEVFDMFIKVLLQKDVTMKDEIKWLRIKDPYKAYRSLYEADYPPT